MIGKRYTMNKVTHVYVLNATENERNAITEVFKGIAYNILLTSGWNWNSREVVMSKEGIVDALVHMTFHHHNISTNNSKQRARMRSLRKYYENYIALNKGDLKAMKRKFRADHGKDAPMNIDTLEINIPK